MRISDWSSDVFSSDLGDRYRHYYPRVYRCRVRRRRLLRAAFSLGLDRHRCGVAWRRGHRGGSISNALARHRRLVRSEEHTSELQSLMRISYAVFCLKKKKTLNHNTYTQNVATMITNNHDTQLPNRQLHTH